MSITGIIGDVALGLGAFFLLVGALGLARMPDVFTRMHASSVTETLGVGLLIIGMMIEVGFGLVFLKLLFILAIFFFLSPVVTHALAQAALASGTEPQLVEDRRQAGGGKNEGETS